MRLARLYRSGHLTAVAVPDLDQEAVRQLVRTRLAVLQHITALKHRIWGVLVNPGHRLQRTATNWTKAHRAWARPAPA